MRFTVSFGFLLLSKLALAQETFSTGLENPCGDELKKWFPPAAAVDVRKLPTPPKTANLEKYLPAVGDQGKQGSCTAFSVASALTILENRLKKKTFKTGPLEYPGELYSPAFIFNVGKSLYPVPRRTNCKDGISYIDAFNVVQDYGIVYMSDFGYNAVGTAGCSAFYYPSDKIKKAALKRRIFTFQKPALQLEIFKYWLSRDYPCPVNIAVTIDKNYKAACDPDGDFTWKQKGSPIVGQDNSLHAMLIVGYDEDRKCFRVLDSRGKKSGDNGFLWLSYDLLTSGVIYDAYVCSFDDEILKDAKSQNSGEADVDIEENSTEPSWVKSGYFRTFNGVKFICTKIDKRYDSAYFMIKDRFTNALLVDSVLRLRIGSEITLGLNDKTFSLRLKEIGMEGRNPFKPAVRFDITLVGEKVNEQFEAGKEWKTIADAFRDCDESLNRMTYGGFSNFYPLGTIVDVQRGNISLVGALKEDEIKDFIVPDKRTTCTISGKSAFEYSIFLPIKDSIKNIVLAASKVEMKFDLVPSYIPAGMLDGIVKSSAVGIELKQTFERKFNLNVISRVVRVSSVEAKFFLERSLKAEVSKEISSKISSQGFKLSASQSNIITIQKEMDVILFFSGHPL